jgi:hypothetical protein
MREKEFVWGSKQVGQNYMCKVKESNWVMVRVKAAVSANLVDFLKKLGTDLGSCKLIPQKLSSLEVI